MGKIREIEREYLEPVCNLIVLKYKLGLNSCKILSLIYAVFDGTYSGRLAN